MRNGFMIIYDEDTEYSRKLSAELSKDEEFAYEIVITGSEEGFRAAFSEGEVTISLVNQDLKEFWKQENTGESRLILLAENEGYDHIDGFPAVYKYQPAVAIKRQILEIRDTETKEISRRAAFQSTALCYIGVASPVGRSLKTSFCITLGQLLASEARVLYVNMEACAGFGALFEGRSETCLSDLLYHYENRGIVENPEIYIRPFHGLDILPPVRTPEDLYETEPETIRSAVAALASAGGYHIILLDLGDDLRLSEAFLPQCRKIYMPVRKDTLALEKAEEFREWFRRKAGEEEALTIEELILPMMKVFTGGKHYLDQLLFSELGDYVRTLIGGYF